MALRDEIIDALLELESENSDPTGATWTITNPSGAVLPCVPGTERVGYDIQIGPQRLTVEYVVFVRYSHFVTADNTVITADSDVILADNSTPRPRTGSGQYRASTFRGKTLRVISVDLDPTAAYFKIVLGSFK